MNIGSFLLGIAAAYAFEFLVFLVYAINKLNKREK